MLTNEEKALIKITDRLVLTEGFEDWIVNGEFQDVFAFLQLIARRQSVIDQEVAKIFKEALLSGMNLLRFEALAAKTTGSFGKKRYEMEKELARLSERYAQTSPALLESYGLADLFSSGLPSQDS